MTDVLLIRHGEPDYSQLDATDTIGPSRDLAPLSALGVQQAHAAGLSRAAQGSCVLISSPTTRALQTAAIISHHLFRPITAVDFDLREWGPDATLTANRLDAADLRGRSGLHQPTEGQRESHLLYLFL